MALPVIAHLPLVGVLDDDSEWAPISSNGCGFQTVDDWISRGICAII
jgi:hypothetical protein